MPKKAGPLLIAANHPNSFLDAIIIATIFKKPVYSLARGDVFKGKFISKILSSLNMLPVYRISEGAENLGNNYSTFDACNAIFNKNGIVLIFSEGRCINEWKLRPLKKGTARLALAAWQENYPLEVLPVGINYSSFRSFGKNMVLNFGTPVTKEDSGPDFSSGKALNQFNDNLQSQLEDLVIVIERGDKENLKKHFYFHQSLFKKIILFIPAVLGYLIHFPLYYPIHFLIRKIANDHYDSIMVGSLFFIYPFYLLAISLALFFITSNYFSYSLLLLIPLTALALLHFKKQIQ
jgi:1-acyl-sn-glycerol-3-phosphate acyltransferase